MNSSQFSHSKLPSMINIQAIVDLHERYIDFFTIFVKNPSVIEDIMPHSGPVSEEEHLKLKKLIIDFEKAFISKEDKDAYKRCLGLESGYHIDCRRDCKFDAETYFSSLLDKLKVQFFEMVDNKRNERGLPSEQFRNFNISTYFYDFINRTKINEMINYAGVLGGEKRPLIQLLHVFHEQNAPLLSFFITYRETLTDLAKHFYKLNSISDKNRQFGNTIIRIFDFYVILNQVYDNKMIDLLNQTVKKIECMDTAIARPIYIVEILALANNLDESFKILMQKGEITLPNYQQNTYNMAIMDVNDFLYLIRILSAIHKQIDLYHRQVQSDVCDIKIHYHTIVNNVLRSLPQDANQHDILYSYLNIIAKYLKFEFTREQYDKLLKEQQDSNRCTTEQHTEIKSAVAPRLADIADAIYHFTKTILISLSADWLRDKLNKNLFLLFSLKSVKNIYDTVRFNEASCKINRCHVMPILEKLEADIAKPGECNVSNALKLLFDDLNREFYLFDDCQEAKDFIGEHHLAFNYPDTFQLDEKKMIDDFINLYPSIEVYLTKHENASHENEVRFVKERFSDYYSMCERMQMRLKLESTPSSIMQTSLVLFANTDKAVNEEKLKFSILKKIVALLDSEFNKQRYNAFKDTKEYSAISRFIIEYSILNLTDENDFKVDLNQMLHDYLNIHAPVVTLANNARYAAQLLRYVFLLVKDEALRRPLLDSHYPLMEQTYQKLTTNRNS